MLLSKYNDVIKTFAPDRADQPFFMPILPWGLRRCWPISNAHRSNASARDFAIGSIPIADEILWCAPQPQASVSCRAILSEVG